MPSKDKNKRQMNEHLIRDVNNFNALQLDLNQDEILMIRNTILEAAKAERRREDEEKLRQKSPSEVAKARRKMEKNREAEDEWSLANKAFPNGVPQRWAVTAMLPVVEVMFNMPPSDDDNDRRQLARKLAKVILSSFDRCANWSTIEHLRDEMAQSHEEKTEQVSDEDVEMNDAVPYDQNEPPTSRYAVPRPSHLVGPAPPLPDAGKTRHSRKTSRADAALPSDNTIAAFINKQSKGKEPAHPTLESPFHAVSSPSAVRQAKKPTSREEEAVPETPPQKAGKKRQKKKGKKQEIKKEKSEGSDL
ncbi:unnamed protein product [Zymoseptoria tritici ST99CH_1A5]|uniref:Uncharacterized protein n=3 Tax=Zymoseptoria tritici TaxID=1047171 RepID=F9XQK5_ZYMTI|nr:uncharacterized protein MYCGRDRAFT_97550 [Zymoseptoria tritici IPO323]EGP82379.1 hypothetical protein MYCGRDRAFT_97550 [Zymoseptoria tritici IPO323]SMR62231.1 unnamed protein product [Zymoseptoria tritici ST99CH_1E4]SMR64716.1 unnamed protein product [Zymoseptoria tritici ST99CH_3D1]SMY30054.1 unnamed protein product [Zymoseptoria tritici ST99CH_1A5]